MKIARIAVISSLAALVSFADVAHADWVGWTCTERSHPYFIPSIPVPNASGTCFFYNWGGVSHVHYYACCDVDANPTDVGYAKGGNLGNVAANCPPYAATNLAYPAGGHTGLIAGTQACYPGPNAPPALTIPMVGTGGLTGAAVATLGEGGQRNVPGGGAITAAPVAQQPVLPGRPSPYYAFQNASLANYCAHNARDYKNRALAAVPGLTSGHGCDNGTSKNNGVNRIQICDRYCRNTGTTPAFCWKYTGCFYRCLERPKLPDLAAADLNGPSSVVSVDSSISGIGDLDRTNFVVPIDWEYIPYDAVSGSTPGDKDDDGGLYACGCDDSLSLAATDPQCMTPYFRDLNRFDISGNLVGTSDEFQERWCKIDALGQTTTASANVPCTPGPGRPVLGSGGCPPTAKCVPTGGGFGACMVELCSVTVGPQPADVSPGGYTPVPPSGTWVPGGSGDDKTFTSTDESKEEYPTEDLGFQPPPQLTSLLPGKVTVIKPGRLAKLVVKLSTPLRFAQTPGTDPTIGGGSLRVLDTGSSAGDETYPLFVQTPPLGWTALGTPSGSKGYKYKGLGAGSDPCKVVLVKNKVVKAVCKGSGIGLAPPFTGDAGFVLSLGATPARYCTTFGGTPVQNSSTVFKRKDAPEAGCAASPSGAFIDYPSDPF
jgi:hypothetical protein